MIFSFSESREAIERLHAELTAERLLTSELYGTIDRLRGEAAAADLRITDQAAEIARLRAELVAIADAHGSTELSRQQYRRDALAARDEIAVLTARIGGLLDRIRTVIFSECRQASCCPRVDSVIAHVRDAIGDQA